MANNELIRQALTQLDIKFEEQKTFDGFHLPFDFYLPDHKCLVEVGKKPDRNWHYFATLKNIWSDDNGYLLLRVPYIVDSHYLIVQGLTRGLNL